MREKLTKLERQSRIRDAMMEISNEISAGFKKRHAKVGVSLESATISVDMEQTNVVENTPALVSPSTSLLYTGDETP